MGAAPGQFQPLDPLEARDGLGPCGAGRLGRAPCVQALSFRRSDLRLGGLGTLSGRIEKSPVLGRSRSRYFNPLTSRGTSGLVLRLATDEFLPS